MAYNLQQGVAFQAIVGRELRKKKKKTDQNAKHCGLQEDAAKWGKELKRKRRSRCLVGAQTARQGMDGVTRVMCLGDELEDSPSLQRSPHVLVERGHK